MHRIVYNVLFVVCCGACLVMSWTVLNAYSPDENSTSTEFRENLLPAQQGDANAQVFVAYLYETGQGVTRNYSKAAEWYGRAARQGNKVAQTQLGNMYRLGRGVPQNYVMAYMWLDLASKKGSTQAVQLKSSVSGKMTKEQIAEAKKLLKNWNAKR
jgi:TPR repeat protein